MIKYKTGKNGFDDAVFWPIGLVLVAGEAEIPCVPTGHLAKQKTGFCASRNSMIYFKILYHMTYNITYSYLSNAMIL